MRLRERIAVDRLMRGADHPHSESSLPKSLDVLDRILDGVPEDECEQMLCKTTADLYQFDVEKLGS